MIIENDTGKKYKKVITVALVILALGWMIYQQMTLNAIRKIVMPAANVSIPAAGGGGINSQGQETLSDEVVEQRKSELIANTRELTGTVASVSGSTLKVEAEIVNLEKIKETAADDPETFAKTKKNFSVATNDKTEFLSKKLVDIREGDSILVYTNDAVYTLDNITATRIVSPVVSAEDAATPGPKFVSGKAAKIENNVMTVTAISKDGKEEGSYVVKIAAGTKITKREFSNPPKDTEIKLSDIKQGDGVMALAAEAIGNRTSFEATEIILMIAPPKK
ncbi:MAG: hypothetical protein QMD77_01685 [Patescibacteria group bacterium]|nr:hypothetical protein [Patescibacteria group bacterium]